MTDMTIKPIKSPQQMDASSVARTQTTEFSISQQAAAKPKVEEQNTTPVEERSLANVSIQFRVDESTKDVTVFLVDRKSKKVLRSIPASELSKLQISDLLKLTV